MLKVRLPPTLVVVLLIWAAGFFRPAGFAQTISHGIAAANIQVVQHDNLNNTGSVTITTPVSINQFKLRDGSSRGDYFVQIGDSFSDNASTGILMASVAENGRDNGETNYPGANFCTCAIDYGRSGGGAGGYYVSTFNAPTGTEYNINVSAAWFPYSSWIGGHARNSNSTNGGANDLFTGSPGLILGTHYVDNGGGVSTVNLTNLGVDSRTSGVLLVTHGKNEDNYALSMVNSNNGTWTVYIKDNGTDAAAYEQDPVAFVFIPRTNTSVISGRFRSDGAPLIYSGASPQFAVTNTSVGTWRLTIPGHSPSSGVLIVSAEGGFSQNQDNIVSFQADADGWLIQTRDLPGSPPGLQTPSTGLQPVASFVFIPAGLSVALVAPAQNAQNVSHAPALQAAITNSAPGYATAQFFGRAANSNPPTDFAIVALPDTQFYVSSLNGGVPEMFYAQAEWIIANRFSRNIAYVAQLGDITQNGDLKSGSPNTTEWRNATNAMYRLENPTRTLLASGIPYGVAVGNHDEEPIGVATGTTTYYNQYFGINHFTGRPYYAGHYGTTNDNHFDLFSAGGLDFIVLYFKYDDNADPAVLAWGNEVLRTNTSRRAIVITHNFGNTQTPVDFSAQGLAIYNALKTNANVFMMLAGHVTGEGSRVDTFNGNTIRTFVSDYQGWTNGGNGFMRIIDFSPSNNTVVLQTYSPWSDEYSTGPTSEIFFNYNMQHPADTNGGAFALLGTLTNVPSGGVASVSWPGRTYSTAYDWYVTLTDSLGNSTTSPIWSFSTAGNTAPVASNHVLTVLGDAPTNLALTASDINGDPLTYRTNSLPQHGLNSNFNPAAGTLTFSPIRGYRGSDRFTYSASDGYATSSVVTMNLTIIAPADTNANGLPDAWESAYGVTDPNGDNDNDGRSNLDEYSAGTNPTNAVSVLQISGATVAANGHVTLSWASVGGVRYRIQYSNGNIQGPYLDIIRPLGLEMDPASYNTASSRVFVDDFSLTGGPPVAASRYYRIKVVQ